MKNQIFFMMGLAIFAQMFELCNGMELSSEAGKDQELEKTETDGKEPKKPLQEGRPRSVSFFTAFQNALDAKTPEDFDKYCAMIKDISGPHDSYMLIDGNGEDVSPLHTAAADDHDGLIDFLVTNKIVDIHVKNSKDKTALFFAKGVNAARALIKLGIDVNHTLHKHKRGCLKADDFVPADVAKVVTQSPGYRFNKVPCCSRCFLHCCKGTEPSEADDEAEDGREKVEE